MFGVRGGSMSLSLVGWLWADILLGLFVLFLAAANGAPVIAAQPQHQGIDPKPLKIELVIDGTKLLGSDPAAVAAEQTRVAADVQRVVAAEAPRKVALILAYATHDNPVAGDKIAKLVTDPLQNSGGAFDGVVTKNFHELVPGDAGTKVELEIYLYE